MQICSYCKKYSDCFECYICTDLLCSSCDKLFFQEGLDKTDVDGTSEIICTSCTLALTPDGELEKNHLESLQTGKV